MCDILCVDTLTKLKFLNIYYCVVKLNYTIMNDELLIQTLRNKISILEYRLESHDAVANRTSLSQYLHTISVKDIDVTLLMRHNIYTLIVSLVSAHELPVVYKHSELHVFDCGQWVPFEKTHSDRILKSFHQRVFRLFSQWHQRNSDLIVSKKEPFEIYLQKIINLNDRSFVRFHAFLLGICKKK